MKKQLGLEYREKKKENCFFYTHISLLTPNMWVFPHQVILQFLAATNRMTYNLIHYDINYLELVQTPQVKALVPRLPLTSHVYLKSQVVTSDQLAINQGFL